MHIEQQIRAMEYEVRSRLSNFVKRRGRGPRIGSYPFVSGDTFRSIADILWEDLLRDSGVERGRRDQGLRLFIEPSDLPQLFQFMEVNDLATDRWTLLVHNGDRLDVDIVEAVAPRVQQMFCVNWLGSRETATPIPIGLENAYLNTNGRPGDYLECLPMNRPALLSKSRTLSAVCAVRTHTNPQIREPLVERVARSKLVTVIDRSIKPKNHRELMKESWFVFSPPGNGPDCHRTWEAIYHGAIPIVLNDYWPFTGMGLPVLEVSDWDEALSIIGSDPASSWLQIRQATQDAIWFHNFADSIL